MQKVSEYSALSSCRLLPLLAMLLGTAIAGSAESALAQDQEEWKMHIIWPSTRIEAGYYQTFVDRINQDNEGALSIQLYPGNALNIDESDLLRAMPPGTIVQIAGTYAGYLTRDVPEFNYVLPAGVLSTADQLVDLLPDLQVLYEPIFAEHGLRLVSFVGHGAPRTNIFCKTPVNTLTDLRANKLRVWERFHVDVFTELGVAAQVIPQNDLYTALATGVVDCAVFPLAGAQALSLHEVAPYAAYLFPYAIHPLKILVSERAWERLDESTQQAVEAVAQEIEAESFELYAQGEHDQLAASKLKDAGVTILDDFSEDDRAEFTAAAMKLWDTMCESANEAGKDICVKMQARVLQAE